MSSKISIHSINPNHTLDLVKRAKANGFYYPVVKFVDDASPLVFVKQIEPRTKTVARYINPVGDWEGCQDVGSWNQARREQFAKESIDLIFNNANDAQLKAVDYFTVQNEPDPKGHYDGLGLALIELVKEADQRHIHLALPCLPQGCPEWTDMVRLVNTGLFGYIKRGGHIYDTHEGVLEMQPVDLWYGDLIPDSPRVAGAGACNFRHRYIYSLLEQRNEVVPLFISEFYAGGGYSSQSNASTLERFKWYDVRARQEPYLLGFAGFTCDPSTNWQQADYTPFYESAELLAYQIAEKDKVDDVTNQQFLNAVATVGHKNGRNLFAQMPHDLLDVMVNNRTAEYTGPSPLTWGLTDAEKQQVTTLLGLH
jgi:hypothetical protein